MYIYAGEGEGGDMVVGAQLYSDLGEVNSNLETKLKSYRLMTGQEITDCNDLPLNSIGYTYPSSVHAPAHGVHILTYGIFESDKAQISVGNNGSTIYTRTCSDGTWSAWESFVKNTDFTIITNVQLTANQAIRIPGAPTQRCLTTVTGERDVHNFDYSIHQDNNREWWIWSNVSQAIDIGFLAIK